MIPEGNPTTRSCESAYLCEPEAFDLRGQSIAATCRVATPTAGRPCADHTSALPPRGEGEIKRERKNIKKESGMPFHSSAVALTYLPSSFSLSLSLSLSRFLSPGLSLSLSLSLSMSFFLSQFLSLFAPAPDNSRASGAPPNAIDMKGRGEGGHGMGVPQPYPMGTVFCRVAVPCVCVCVGRFGFRLGIYSLAACRRHFGRAVKASAC